MEENKPVIKVRSLSILSQVFVESNNIYPIQEANERFLRDTFVPSLKHGLFGTCAVALEDCDIPEPKSTKSVLLQNVLRIGDVEGEPENAIEIYVKTSKCTSLVRPVSLKKFGKREGLQADVSTQNGMTMVNLDAIAPLARRTEFLIERGVEEGDGDEEEEDEKEKIYEKVEKEQLVKAYKYGATWVPCEDDAWEKLHTTKGIDVIQFFPASKVRRPCASSNLPLNDFFDYSFIANTALAKFNTYSGIPIMPSLKSRFHRLFGLCSLKTSMRS